MAGPDEVNRLPDGSREEIRYRRSPNPQAVYSRIRKIVGPDGRTREVWHEVLDGQGNLLHQHAKFLRDQGYVDAG